MFTFNRFWFSDGFTYTSSYGVYDHLDKVNVINPLPNRSSLHRTDVLMKNKKIVLNNTKDVELNYENEIKPTIPWKPAELGAAKKCSGILGKMVPEIRKIPPEKFQEALEETRYG